MRLSIRLVRDSSNAAECNYLKIFRDERIVKTIKLFTAKILYAINIFVQKILIYPKYCMYCLYTYPRYSQDVSGFIKNSFTRLFSLTKKANDATRLAFPLILQSLFYVKSYVNH